MAGPRWGRGQRGLPWRGVTAACSRDCHGCGGPRSDWPLAHVGRAGSGDALRTRPAQASRRRLPGRVTAAGGCLHSERSSDQENDGALWRKSLGYTVADESYWRQVATRDGRLCYFSESAPSSPHCPSAAAMTNGHKPSGLQPHTKKNSLPVLRAGSPKSGCRRAVCAPKSLGRVPPASPSSRWLHGHFTPTSAPSSWQISRALSQDTVTAR